MSREPENLVLRALRDIRADVAETKAELKSLGAAVASDFLTVNAKIEATRKELSDQIVGLRRAVVEYHSVVIGRGVLISELEARLRRVEQHLNLAAAMAPPLACKNSQLSASTRTPPPTSLVYGALSRPRITTFALLISAGTAGDT